MTCNIVVFIHWDTLGNVQHMHILNRRYFILHCLYCLLSVSPAIWVEKHNKHGLVTCNHKMSFGKSVLIHHVLHVVKLSPTPGDSMNEWCPQCSVLNSLVQCLQTHAHGFFYGVNPSRISPTSFPAAFQFSSCYCVFQRTLPSRYVPKVEQLLSCHFLPPAMFHA